MRVRFVDLSAQTSEIMERVTAEIEQIHAHTAYIGGQHVERFEHEFADFLGSKRVVGVANGTDALRMALMAVGIQPGDNVVTVPMTFIATGAQSCRPVTPDVRRYRSRDRHISIPELRKSSKARPATATAQFERLCRYIYTACRRDERDQGTGDEFKFKIVRGRCQAHGARIATSAGWKRAGTIGDDRMLQLLSRQKTSAHGDGGAIATDDDEIAHSHSSLANHGRLSHYAHEICGSIHGSPGSSEP